ncbi:hypothetical protein MMC08_003534 [Hypocenomyce scalaris]|nr:hypothetical protein [Hypocenomyce scalaris]
MIVRQQGWVGTLGGEATGASCTGLAVFEAGLLRNARYGTLVRGHSGAPRRLKLYQHDECSNEQATTRYEPRLSIPASDGRMASAGPPGRGTPEGGGIIGQ